MITDAEKALIGALMMDPHEVKKCEGLRPDMFNDALLGRVYLEYLRASDFGYSVDLVTIAANIPEIPQGELLDRLRECADDCITSAAAGRYADVIRNEYRARAAKQIVNTAQFIPATVNTQIGEVVNALEALRDNDRTKAKKLAQIIEETAHEYFTDIKKPRLYTGFSQLDECLGGLEGGDMIVVGARPAVGKSAFVTQILTNMARQGKRVLLYNLEMQDSQIYERMISRVSGIRLNRVRRAKSFLNDEQERFWKGNAELKKLDIWISSGAKTVSEIRNECRNMGADCIIIDYLQLIRSDRKYANRTSEVGEISKSIKALAMELNRPIIVLSQLNRASEGRETKEPSMSELRESGDIEQDASVIMLLWNTSDEDKSQKGLKVEKNRQGEQTKIGLEFIGDTMTFDECEYKELKAATKKTPFD